MPRKATDSGTSAKVKKEDQLDLDAATLPCPSNDDQDMKMSYRIARGEQGVLTFEPYKSILLPYWRFKTVPIAQQSSTNLKKAFDHYVRVDDFVGADMARKFIQMGMTRAKRYANHKGGRKYERTKGVKGEEGRGKELAKSEGHEGRDEKLEASEVFKKVWRNCTEDAKYLEMKAEFQREQKEWDKAQKKVKKEEGIEIKPEAEVEVKKESDDD